MNSWVELPPNHLASGRGVVLVFIPDLIEVYYEYMYLSFSLFCCCGKENMLYCIHSSSSRHCRPTRVKENPPHGGGGGQYCTPEELRRVCLLPPSRSCVTRRFFSSHQDIKQTLQIEKEHRRVPRIFIEDEFPP